MQSIVNLILSLSVSQRIFLVSRMYKFDPRSTRTDLMGLVFGERFSDSAKRHRGDKMTPGERSIWAMWIFNPVVCKKVMTSLLYLSLHDDLTEIVWWKDHNANLNLINQKLKRVNNSQIKNYLNDQESIKKPSSYRRREKVSVRR